MDSDFILKCFRNTNIFCIILYSIRDFKHLKVQGCYQLDKITDKINKCPLNAVSNIRK